MINVVFDKVEKGCEIRVPTFSRVWLGTLIDCVEKSNDLIGRNGIKVSAIEILAEPYIDKFIGTDGIFFSSGSGDTRASNGLPLIFAWDTSLKVVVTRSLQYYSPVCNFLRFKDSIFLWQLSIPLDVLRLFKTE